MFFGVRSRVINRANPVEQGTDRLLLTVKRGPVRYFVILKPIYTQPTAWNSQATTRKSS